MLQADPISKQPANRSDCLSCHCTLTASSSNLLRLPLIRFLSRSAFHKMAVPAPRITRHIQSHPCAIEPCADPVAAPESLVREITAMQVWRRRNVHVGMR